jgi:hypothetical protein
MAFKFNPITGKLDVVSGETKKDTIKSILINSDETALPFTLASIIFEEDSILYNDDCEVS